MTTTSPTTTATLGEAQDWLRDHVNKGTDCPCCTQFAKVYRRKLNSDMARSLIAMYRAGAHVHWVDIKEIDVRGGDYGKLVYWGLTEEERGTRDDGSGRTGWWQITSKGQRFVENNLTVAKYALVYNGRLQRLDYSDGMTSIVDALGDHFNYRELMA